MLLSDRDLKAALASGRMALAPYDEAMVQPSSIDVRLDRYFRVFHNHRYTHIDPAAQQDDLTELVEVPDGEAFLLHPGEFVLGSTLEVVTLGDALAARPSRHASAPVRVEVPAGRAFLLHPGEFVLGSTLEVVTLGDDLASRLEGKALALDTEVPTPGGWTTLEHRAGRDG